MSDGHFNRALLPRTDYQSGYRAGHAASQRQAETAFRQVVEAAFPHASAEDVETACRLFKERLNP